MITTYPYLNDAGDEVFQVCRIGTGPNKRIWQRHHRDGKYIHGKPDGANGLLYEGIGVIDAVYRQDPQIAICEGEKDCNTLWREEDIAATTNHGGAGNSTADQARHFLGYENTVLVFADDDPKGMYAAMRWHDLLVEYAYLAPEQIRLLLPPEGTGDVTEAYESGYRLADFRPTPYARLKALAPERTREALKEGTPIGSKGPTPEEIKILEEMQRDGIGSKARTVLGRTFTRGGLKTLPKPEPLIEGWLDLRTAGVLIGEDQTNKTFLLIAWACCIATGTPWFGQKICVEPSPVILVIGEGGSGLDDRIAAWESANGVSVPDDMLTVHLQPDSITKRDVWDELTEHAVQIGARFVAFDTFSSLAPEADETNDIAPVIRRLSEFVVAIDGCGLLAHHTGWGSQDRARGGSQFERNTDFVIVAKKLVEGQSNSPVSLTQKKVKDGRENGTQLTVHRVPEGESCVLETVENTRQQTWTEQILELLRDEPREHKTMRSVFDVIGAGRSGRKYQTARKEWIALRDSEQIREGEDGIWSIGDGRIRVGFKRDK